jgi:pyruvate dehydrogenase E2 component (dihydrolipoamide acetyltransferase)
LASRKDINVPDIGDFENVEIVEVHVSAGDHVALEDPLITLETDKASMEVPATAAGVVASVAVKQGDRVSQGDLVCSVETGDEAAEEAKAEEQPTAAPTSAEPGKAAGQSVEVRVPDIGDFSDVDVIDVHVSEGDNVKFDDPLITLETDKASMDVPATAAGVVMTLSVGVGSKVSQGDPIVTLKTTGTDDAVETGSESGVAPSGPPPPEAAAPEKSPGRDTETLRVTDEKGFAEAHASPSVRRFARELGVDLGRIQGSGRKGRITREDVKAFVKSTMSGAAPAAGLPPAVGLPQIPEVDFSRFGDIEIQPLSRIQKISGPRLHASWVNLPHVTQFDEVDITALEERRQKLKERAAKQGARLTPLAFLIVACVNALKEFPRFNSSLDPSGENLVFKKYFHLGFAADTPNGLVVPVLKDADKMTLLEIARQLATLSAKARDGKLSPVDMQGGTFTVSSLGSIGGTAFTPIINAPEVAILGVSRSYMKPVWIDDAFRPRLTLPLSLSYDHRVIDGAEAVRFTRFLAEQLEDPDGLMLA